VTARARMVAVDATILALLAAGDSHAAEIARPHARASEADIILSEVMVNPTGPEYAREYVELYNRGAVPVSLSGWAIGDSLDMDAIVAHDAGLVLGPGRYALVLDPSYFEVSAPYDSIPPDALVVTIEDASFGRGGLVNSRPADVVLRSPGGLVRWFAYAPGEIVEGYSFEKIDPDGGDEAANWALSLLENGTPGRPNTRRILDRNAALVAAVASPDTIRPPGETTIRAVLANAGREPVAGAEVVLYADEDGDSLLSPGDAVLARTDVPTIARREQSEVTLAWRVEAPPGCPLFVAVRFEGDGRRADDGLPLRLVVGLPEASIRINEIMADPAPGEGLWVEIVNAGSVRVPLAGCALASPRGTRELAWTAPALAAGDLLVLAAFPDSVRLAYGPDVPLCGVDGAFPPLSRSADANRTVWFVDAAKAVVDRAAYPIPERGRSLERISSDAPGDDPSSWRIVRGPHRATPGLVNQALEPLAPEASVAISPSPPADTAGIAIDLPEAEVYLTVRIYDRLGREVRRLVDGERWPAHSRIAWDGRDAAGRVAPTGMYVLLIEATATTTGRTHRLTRPVVIARTR